jgi:hypothetical protein
MGEPDHVGAQLVQGGISDVAPFGFFRVIAALVCGHHHHLLYGPVVRIVRFVLSLTVRDVGARLRWRLLGVGRLHVDQAAQRPAVGFGRVP